MMMVVKTFSLVSGDEGDAALDPPSFSSGVPLGLASCEGDRKRGERFREG